jgi:hypothetical protein
MADPTIVSFTATGSRVLVAKHQRRYCALQYGRFPAELGITFTAVVQVPTGTSGVLEFVQDVISLRRRTGGPAGTECQSTNGQRMLDTTDPYDGPFPVGAGVHTVTTNDSPSTPLPYYEIKQVTEQFRMFLMWTDDTTPRNRVVLGKIQWMWQGKAEATAKPGDCAQGNFAWRRTDNGQGAGNWETGDSPVLTPNVTSLTWQPC